MRKNWLRGLMARLATWLQGLLVLGNQVHHLYRVECWDKDPQIFPDARLKWVEEIPNLVTTAGLNKYLDATLKTGLAAPAWYLGLKNAGTVADGDTMAAHAGWTENTSYSNSNRPAWTPGAIAGGSVDNTGAPAGFNINANATIYGAFICDDNTKGGGSGTLLGAGDFSASRALTSGDVLNITAAIAITAS